MFTLLRNINFTRKKTRYELSKRNAAPERIQMTRRLHCLISTQGTNEQETAGEPKPVGSLRG